jgi:hypothetical protein
MKGAGNRIIGRDKTGGGRSVEGYRVHQSVGKLASEESKRVALRQDGCGEP